MTYNNLRIFIFLIFTSHLVMAQTYPNVNNVNNINNHNNATLTNNQSNINLIQNNNQKSQPNIMVAYPPTSVGVPSNNPNAGMNNALRQQGQRPPASPPVNPGYDTSSSLGGPSNSQGSITYSSNGSIKTQNSR
jgi:hypothetical protein